MSKVLEKIKKNVKQHAEEKGLKPLHPKSEVKKSEVKQVEAKQEKPKAIRDTFDAYHIETGSLASQVIAHILDCNRKNKDITMKDIKAKFGNTFYSIFCRLEERGLAHREGKLLFVHEIDGNKEVQKILPIIRPRIGANDYINEEEKKKIDKLLSSK